MNRFCSIGLLFMLLTASACKSLKKQEESKALVLKREQILQQNIIATLQSANGSHYEFYPKDTIIELPNETDIILWKNSFITSIGDVYQDKVSVDFEFEQDTLDILYSKNLAITALSPSTKLKGLIKFVIKDNKGNRLNFNPNYSMGIRFLPPTMMLGGFFFLYDSVQKVHYSSIKTYTIFRQKSNDDYSNSILILDDMVYPDSINQQNESSKYKNTRLTKKQVIGHELTQKYPGFYFIGRKVKDKNFKEVAITINLSLSDILNHKKTKVFLFSQDEDYNFYLNAKYSENGIYSIVPAREYSNIKLHLDKKYTIFAYQIKEGKSYMAVLKNMTLNSTNSFNLTLKEVEIDKMIEVIREL